ncbi:unnamed protein product, partial [Mesorhabditis spiculigera]
MFEIFTHGFTFLNLLSIIAFITTVGLFFCGIPICRQILKRKDTKEIAAAPFLMGILGGTCWMSYGYLKGDHTVMYVTGTQIILYTSYTLFYWFMTKDKFGITLKVLFIVILSTSIAASSYHFRMAVFHPLGWLCMTLNAADFAAPLAGLKTVIRRGATSTLPLPLCIANFLVSTEWFVYGLLVWDFYLITPNGIGSVLALAQVMLFVVLPRKPGQQSPIRRLVNLCRRDTVADIETAAVVEPTVGLSTDDEKDAKMPPREEQSWPSMVISTLEHELDNVISRVTAHEQFGYSTQLDEEGSSDNEKTLTDRKLAKELAEARRAETVERPVRERSTTVREDEQEEEAAAARIHRSSSSPNLSV